MNVSFSVRKMFDSITPQIKNMRTAMGISGRRRVLISAGDRFKKLAQATFGTGGRYRGNNWPAYSPEYAEKERTSSPTLLRSGALKNSIKTMSPRTNYVEVFTALPYASAQFFGNPKKKLPGRRFFPMESAGSTMWRLGYSAEKDMVVDIQKRFMILSNGALPYISSIMRSRYEYGNPRLSAQYSGK